MCHVSVSASTAVEEQWMYKSVDRQILDELVAIVGEDGVIVD